MSEKRKPRECWVEIESIPGGYKCYYAHAAKEAADYRAARLGMLEVTHMREVLEGEEDIRELARELAGMVRDMVSYQEADGTRQVAEGYEDIIKMAKAAGLLEEK